MSIRRRLSLRAPISLFSSLLLASGVLTTGIILGTAGPASAFPQVTIYLTNSTSYCADVKDSRNVSGQPIWLYKCSQAGDYHFYEVGGINCVAGSNCYNFEDVQNTSLCLSATSGRTVALGTCNAGLSAWYRQGGNHMGNGFYGASGDLTVYSPLSNGDLLYAAGSSSGAWQQWSGW